MTLPTEDVAALVARLRDGLSGVTPGPWTAAQPVNGMCDMKVYAPAPDTKSGKRVVALVNATKQDADAAFIALCSPDNIRALLDHIAAQDAALSTLAGERDEAWDIIEKERGTVAMLSADAGAWHRRATTAEAQVVALREALDALIDATRAYLPPDGISKDDLINRVLAATDNPKINAFMMGGRNGAL